MSANSKDWTSKKKHSLDAQNSLEFEQKSNCTSEVKIAHSLALSNSQLFLGGNVDIFPAKLLLRKHLQLWMPERIFN